MSWTPPISYVRASSSCDVPRWPLLLLRRPILPSRVRSVWCRNALTSAADFGTQHHSPRLLDTPDTLVILGLQNKLLTATHSLVHKLV